MTQLGHHLSFPLEPLAAILILTEMGGKELEGDFTIQLRVLRQIHFSHPTGTNLLDNPVVIDHCSLSQSNERSGLIILVFVWRHGQAFLVNLN
jgi:hypothetical protein